MDLKAHKQEKPADPVEYKVHNKKALVGTKEKNGKPKKDIPPTPKTVRDTYTMPQGDYDLIEALITRCMKQGVRMNKSEIVRAGLKVLNSMSDSKLQKAAENVEKIKPGRRGGK